jgi:hypothetical protein
MYVDQEFIDLRAIEGALTLQDITLARCSFLGCSLWSLTDVHRRHCVRNVTLSGCEVIGESSTVRGAIVEDCTVDGLKTGGLLHLDGCVFKHVVLRGAIGRVMLTDAILFSPWLSQGTTQAYAEANAKYYSTVDWALDISESMPTDLSTRGIPAKLIRRNPETQVMFTRERLLDGRWQQLDLDSVVRYWLSYLVRNGWADGVFVVPARGTRRRAMMDSMLTLRREGIAEPD